MRYSNIMLPNGETINTYCGEITCKTCQYKRKFEYPWKVPNKERSNQKELFELTYCKHFSLWAKPYEIDTLLPEPLEYDEENNCLRHEKCLRSELAPAATSKKEERDEDKKSS